MNVCSHIHTHELRYSKFYSKCVTLSSFKQMNRWNLYNLESVRLPFHLSRKHKYEWQNEKRNDYDDRKMNRDKFGWLLSFVCLSLVLSSFFHSEFFCCCWVYVSICVCFKYTRFNAWFNRLPVENQTHSIVVSIPVILCIITFQLISSWRSSIIIFFLQFVWNFIAFFSLFCRAFLITIECRSR